MSGGTRWGAVAVMACGAVSAQDCVPRFPGPSFELPNPSTMRVADLDGNATADLLVAAAGNGLRAFVDVHDLQLPPPVSSPASVPYYAVLATGDWNSDGFGDAALFDAVSTNQPVGVYIGDGAGGFAFAGTVANVGHVVAVATLDYDNDGHDDVLGVDGIGAYLRVLRGGIAGLALVNSVGVPANCGSIAAADFNGDGFGDVAVKAYTQGWTLHGDGAGQFTLAAAFAPGTGSYSSLAVGDFDGDGSADWASSDSTIPSVRVLLNDGTGVFGSASILQLDAPALDLRASDWNGDGRSDLWILVDTSELRLALADAQGGFHFARRLPAPVGIDGFEFVDLDGDQDLDLAAMVHSNDSTLAFYEQVAGELRVPRRVALHGSSTSLAFADVDGDGEVDLAAGGGTLQFARGLGAGRFEDAAIVVPDYQTSRLATADLDRDGAAEILSATNTALGIYRGVPAGLPVLVATHSAAAQATDIECADFDDDGNDDIALVTWTDRARVLLGDGALGFALAWDGLGGADPLDVEVLDFDQDGRLDLAVAGSVSNDVVLHRGRGDGTFQLHASFIVGVTPRRMQAADLDRDGREDLLIQANGASSLSFWKNTPAGFQNAATSTSALGFPFAWTLDDLDGDLQLDLVCCYLNSSRVRLATGQGDGSFGPPITLCGSGSNSGITTADLDGDGRREIAASAVYTVGPSTAYAVSIFPHDRRPPERYCTAKLNSQGCLPALEFDGCASTGGAFFLRARELLNQRATLLFYGHERSAAPLLGGTLCVSPPLARTPLVSSGGSLGATDCSGRLDFDFSAWVAGGHDPSLAPGVQVCCQVHYRDGASSFGAGLSDAVEFTLLP